MSTLIDQSELKAFVPIYSLSPDNIQEIANKTHVETIGAGKFVFKKGESDKKHIYLLSGNIELQNDKQVFKTIAGGSEDAKQPLAHSQPRHVSARAKDECNIIRVDSDLLDIMMTWDQTGTYHVEELGNEHESQQDEDWMMQLLQTKAFLKVPPANIQAIFMRMKQVQYKPGDVIIKQGEEGDYFYIIKNGRALVTRSTASNPKGIKLAELSSGDSFGEEALISEDKRNATITMLTPGTLVRLSKQDFISLLNEPNLYWLDYNKAKEKAQSEGLEWLDIRLPGEFQLNHIKNAVNIPLISMRLKLKNLDTSKKYILYCDTGRRSSAAAYILSENGISCFVLKDGLNAVPDEDKASG